MDKRDKFVRRPIKQEKADTWFVGVLTFKYQKKIKVIFALFHCIILRLLIAKFSLQKHLYLKVCTRNNTGILSKIP